MTLGWTRPVADRPRRRLRDLAIALLLLVVAFGAIVQPAALRGGTVRADDGTAAVFEPLDGATSFGPSAFGRVVADGDGTFLAAHRVQLPIGQFIGVRRSRDGGRTWGTVGLFAGSSGGATRPWISVSGARVAVGFIGGWCDPSTPGVCGEAPYLATSTDSGASWSNPRRLDRQAFEIRVAQDGARTWVAWERSGNVELRGTRDGGTTMFATRSMYADGVVELAAADGLAVLAYRSIVDRTTRAPLALVARGDSLATTASPLADPFGDEDVLPLAVGVADGRMHVLTRRSLRAGRDSEPKFIDVMTASSDGVFDTVHVIGEAGWSASLVAGPGTVGVAIGGRDGVTSVATSSDGGDSFSALVPVTNTGEREPNVQIGLAVRPPARPIARFGWSVPPRLVDEDGDGFVDPANDTGIASGDQLRVYGGRTLDVTLDGCASTAPTGRTIASYQWTEVQPDGTSLVLPLGACRQTMQFESGEETTFRLDVVDSAGERSSTVQVVAPKDLVVASLGDSVASGEGNPHEPAAPGFPARWQDGSCHRSVNAGPAVAAKRLEDADPHTSVTFIQLACSGAAIVDSPEVPGIDDPTTGGVLDAYIGQEPAPGSLRPSQMEQLAELIGTRQVDALMLSVGANDARFSDVVMACIKTSHCERTNVRTEFEARAATLPGRYARLASAIEDLGVDSSAVHITEYFDPTRDELGVIQMRCAVLGGAFELLDDDESRWAATGVMGALNGAVSAASAAHGWTYVGGMAAAFDRHGYCSTDPWVVQIAESRRNQGNVAGAFHPNGAGHAAYGEALFGSLRNALLLPAPVGGGTAVGSDLLGDLVVLTSTRSSIVATGVRDTGGTPGVLGSQLVDRIVAGHGGLYSFGPVAVDRTAAVAVWTELPISGLTLTEEFAAQIAVRPNAAVRAVSVVQAPTGGRLLVAGRDALVSATIDAAIDQPMDLTVSLDVVTLPGDPHDSTAPPGRPVTPSTSTTVRVRPGINRVLLPTTAAFQLAPGEQVSATVTVIDPPGASPADDVDNTLSTDDSIAKEAIETRPLTIEFTSPTTGAGRVSCSDLSEIARRQLSFLRAATPVDGVGVLPMLSCGDLLYPLEQNEASILRYLGVLDWLARHSQADVMVGVVPGGWLAAATGGAVGVAAPGLRAAIIEESAPAMTLAHEVGHTFGVDHVAGDLRATGARVDQRRNVDGTDWMAFRTPEKAWTGASTWDSLAVRIGPPGGVPAPPEPLSPELEINGMVTDDGDHVPGDWVPGDTGSPRYDLDELELERMLVEQVDDGVVLSSEPVPLGPVEGLYGPGTTDIQPIGSAYATRITLRPDATAVRLVLDGVVVDERPVTTVPDVIVTSPVAGTIVRRGDPITVEWSTAGPVGADSTATVLISQDDGGTWKPLARGVVGSTVVVDAPADLIDGDAVVRVVVVVGVRSGRGDSGVFDIGVPVQLLPERVVAVRADLIDLTVPGATMPAQPGLGIWTLNPDGTDMQVVVPMVPPVDGQGGMVPLHPDWRSDGMAIAFDGEVSGRRDLYVVDRDGANLRRITDETTSPGLQFVCADWHPDGRQLVALRADSFDPNAVTNLSLVVVDSVTGVVTPLEWGTNNYNKPVTGIGCPRWSPDGGEILMADELRDRWAQSSTNVYVIDAVTQQSKYAYAMNNGALQSNAYTTWLNFAPTNNDRFVAIQEVSQFGILRVAEPVSTPLFIGEDIVYRDLPNIVWSTDEIPMIQQYKGLFGSAGFMPDGNSLWFTSNHSLASRRYSEERWDWRVGAYTVVVTEQVGHLCRVPVRETFEATDPVTCYAPGTDGTPVDAIGDITVSVRDPLPDAPTIGISMADWHSGVTQGVDPSPPVVIGDPATLPPDPEDPPPPDVDVPSPEGTPAAGADDVPPGDTPVPLAITITVPAGKTTTAALPSSGGAPTPFRIVAPPTAGTVEVRPASPSATDPTSTGTDGAVEITPAPGFIGTTSFRVAPRGDDDAAVTITVEVVPAAVPVAGDDRIEVERGAVVVVDAAILLANDGSPDALRPPAAALAAAPLQIVSVFGFDGGTAVLRLDGKIEVQADAPGSFTYMVADAAGVTANARVVVALAAALPTSTPTTPPSSSPSTSTMPPTITSPSTITSPPTITVPTTIPAPGVGGAITTTPSGDAGVPTSDGARLPETGSDPGIRLRQAAGMVLVGAMLLLMVRRHGKDATVNAGGAAPPSRSASGRRASGTRG